MKNILRILLCSGLLGLSACVEPTYYEEDDPGFAEEDFTYEPYPSDVTTGYYYPHSSWHDFWWPGRLR